MVEKEEEVKQEAQEERKKSRFTLFRIFGSIFLFGLAIGLGLIKYYNPDFPLVVVIIIGAFILISILAVLFGYKIQEKFRKVKKIEEEEEKQPKPISIEEARNLARISLAEPEYADYIDEPIEEGTEEHGKEIKSTIYVLRCTGIYFKGTYFIGINMNYPKKRKKILINPTTYQVAEAKKLLAAHPEELPDIEESETYDPLTGRTHKYKKSTPKKKKEKKEEGKEGEVR